MLKKKVCLLGAFGVGKTSLYARFVSSIFSDKYHSTVGVKIDKKIVNSSGREVMLMIWDMAGEEENSPIKLNQVAGAEGYLLVVDGTRGSTLDVARGIHDRVSASIGTLPFVLMVNKADLRAEWEVPDGLLAGLQNEGWTVLETSAKTGDHVDEAFSTLVGRILQKCDDGSGDDDS